jgi:hypothetical protein
MGDLHVFKCSRCGQDTEVIFDELTTGGICSNCFDMMANDLRQYAPGPWKFIGRENLNTDDGPFRSIYLAQLFTDEAVIARMSLELELGKGRSDEEKKAYSSVRKHIKANFTLMESAPELVQRLAMTILNGAEKYAYHKGDVHSEEHYSKYIEYQDEDRAILAKALQCKTEDLTLEALKIIAEVE